MDELILSFGEKVARERKARFLSQAELTDALVTFGCPITEERLNEIEHDRLDVRIHPALLAKLADFFSISADDAHAMAGNYEIAAAQRIARERLISDAVMAFRRSPYLR